MEEITRAKAVELLGEARPVSRQPRKENIMSIRRGHVYMALKMVSAFDKDRQEYLEPLPKITFLVDGKYIRMPVDSGLFTELGRFMVNLGDVLRDVRVPEDEVDMEEVRRKLQAFRGTVS